MELKKEEHSSPKKIDTLDADVRSFLKFFLVTVIILSVIALIYHFRQARKRTEDIEVVPLAKRAETEPSGGLPEYKDFKD